MPRTEPVAFNGSLKLGVSVAMEMADDIGAAVLFVRWLCDVGGDGEDGDVAFALFAFSPSSSIVL